MSLPSFSPNSHDSHVLIIGKSRSQETHLWKPLNHWQNWRLGLFIELFSQYVNKYFISTYYQREQPSLKKSYCSLYRNNRWTLGSYSLKLVDRRYFDLLHKCSLNITEAVKLQKLFPWNAMEAFSLQPNILATTLLTVCYLLHSSFQLWQFFAGWIKQVPSLILFKLFTESLISIRCLRFNPHKRIKSSSDKFCRAVSIIVDKWKTICVHKHRAKTKCQRNQYFSRLIVTEELLP